MTPIEKALALTRIGLHVFPCQPDNKRPYPGTRGFFDATIDPETIATWFTVDHPDALVGVWVGASGLVVADIDTKNGKDGFRALTSAGLSLTPTHRYPTRTGGEHWIYASDADIGPNSDEPVEGVDRRAGGSYIIWWSDEVPADRSVFSSEPPAWLLVAPERVEHTGFVGSIKAWLDVLPQGSPTDKVRRLIDDIPTTEFGHDVMTKLIFRAVRLGSENHSGVHDAIDAIHAAWTRPPFEAVGPDLRIALEGAIRKAGKPQAPLPLLTRYIDVPQSEDLLNLTIAQPIDGDRVAHRQRIFSAAYAEGLDDSQALTLAWGSAAGLADQAEMDVEQMWREAQGLRVTPTAPVAPVEKPKSLLTNEEREFVSSQSWWGTRYLDWVKTKVDYYNAPFHRLGRWAVLSTICSPWGVTAIKGSRPTNCALYMAIPAPSTAGKTDALGFVETVNDAYYGMKESPNLGTLGKLTSNALHRAILTRDGKACFVYTDEAQAFLRDIQESKWQGTLLGDIADYYGVGVVGAKQMINDKEFSGVRGKTFLTTYLTGIDDQMADAMDLSMWTSGLFYRFIWALADPREPDRDEEQADPTFSGEADEHPSQWAAEFRQAERLNEQLGKDRMVSWETDAWARHNLFRRQIAAAYRDHPRFERIIEPALTRFAKSIIKCATLIALAEASPKVTMRHELIAIEQAEEWLAALVTMIDRTSESKFDRDVEEVFQYIAKEPREESDIYKNFKPGDRAERILRQLEHREKRIVRNTLGKLEVGK